jgi:hypothetical protein
VTHKRGRHASNPQGAVPVGAGRNLQQRALAGDEVAVGHGLAAQLGAGTPEDPAEFDGTLPARRSAASERQVALIAAFGARLLPAALRLAGADRPPRSARLVLVGPGGGDWTISPTGQNAPARTPDATVTMDAVEFCYLLGNRRDPDSVPHQVEGDPAVAATLLRAVTTLGCD